MRNLVICAKGPALPEEVILSKVAIVGMSGSGKTNTARKLAEAMMDIDQHIAVFDPTGAWWGLRSSADGQQEGYPIVVFGGSHADAPLRVDAGTMLARSVLKERFNAIFDMSILNDAEIRRFSTDFLNEVNLHNKHPLHIFLDEFDIICPQAKGANSEEVRATVNTTVRRTRIKGVGVTMITQNPQDADKSVLNMADTVISMRTQGSQAIDAIKKWMGRNLSSERISMMVTSLPEIATGTGWLWSPQLKLFARETFLLCKTFDSGKTPKLGEKVIPPKVMAKVDIATLGKKIEAEVQEAKENDVAYLKEKIRKLEAEPKSNDETERVMGLMEEIAELQRERDMYKSASEGIPEMQERLHSYQERENALLGKIHSIIGSLREIVETSDLRPPSDSATAGDILGNTPRIINAPALPGGTVGHALTPTPQRESSIGSSSTPSGKGSQRILDAIATLESIGITKPERLQVALFSDYSNVNSGGFAGPVAALRGEGLIVSESGTLSLTEAGRAKANKPPRTVTNRDLHDRLRALLGEPEWRMLAVLIESYPNGLTRQALASRCGYSNINSGGFANPVARLKRFGFATSNAGTVTGTPLLFLRGRK